MMRGLVSLMLASVAVAIHAQPLMDDFFGGFDPQHGWSWIVPGNAPANTHDPARVSFTAEQLQITARSGTLYQGVNSIRNLPSVSVPALRGAWALETRVRLTRGGASGGYIQAGLVAFRDADHYFNLHMVYLPEQNHWLSVSGGHEWAGVYGWAGLSGMLWNPSAGDTVRLMIRYEPDTGRVRFYYDREDGAHWREFTGSPRPLSDFPALQAVAQAGGQIGLYVDLGGGSGNPAPSQVSTTCKSSATTIPPM
jgi:hypothetical protein